MAENVAKRFDWLKNLHTLVMKTVEGKDLQKQIDVLKNGKSNKRDAAYTQIVNIYNSFSHNFFSSGFSPISDLFDGDTQEDKLFKRLLDDVHQSYARFLSNMDAFVKDLQGLNARTLPQAIKNLEWAEGELRQYVADDLMELISMIYERYGKEENLSLN